YRCRRTGSRRGHVVHGVGLPGARRHRRQCVAGLRHGVESTRGALPYRERMSDISRDTAPAIEVHDLRKMYDQKAAVDGLTLTVPRGCVFGCLGPNGAGKTTT